MMKHLSNYNKYINEKKPAGAPDWHDSDAPDANGRFRDLSPKDLAAWLIKTRKKDLKRISGSLTQQVVFNRNEDPEYAEKMEKTRKEVYKQLGRQDLLDQMDESVNEGKIKLDLKRIMTRIMSALEFKTDPKVRKEIIDAIQDDLEEILPKHGYMLFEENESEDHEVNMAMSQLRAMFNDIQELEDKIFKDGEERDIPAWIQSHISSAYEYIKQANDGFHELKESNKKPGPDAYMTGLDDETEEEKEEMMKKQAEMDDDDPNAYKELPGDKEAREKGKVKTSKHVKSYHELYGDDKDKNEALSDYEKKDAKYDKLYKDYKYKKNKNKKKELVKESRMDSTLNEASQEAYMLSRLAKGIGQDEADEFLSNNDVYLSKVKDALDYRKFTAYDLRDVIKGKASKSVEKKVMGEISADFMSDVFLKTQFRNIVGIGGSVVDDFLKNNPVSIDQLKRGISFNKFTKDDVAAVVNGRASGYVERKVMDYITESVNEEKAKGDRSPIDNKDIETALKNKVEETGVPIEFLRIVMRRGMAAWRTGHRPGAGQEQWGYARVNSFLTKQPGTWGGADKDVAKEVRDGGHDKKLKKA